MEFCLCARGRQWCGIIHYYWWTACSNCCHEPMYRLSAKPSNANFHGKQLSTPTLFSTKFHELGILSPLPLISLLTPCFPWHCQLNGNELLSSLWPKYNIWSSKGSLDNVWKDKSLPEVNLHIPSSLTKLTIKDRCLLFSSSDEGRMSVLEGTLPLLFSCLEPVSQLYKNKWYSLNIILLSETLIKIFSLQLLFLCSKIPEVYTESLGTIKAENHIH